LDISSGGGITFLDNYTSYLNTSSGNGLNLLASDYGSTLGSVSITTGAGSYIGTTFSGAYATAIYAKNTGGGNTTIISNGDVNAAYGVGIAGNTLGTDVNITSAAGTTINAYNVAIVGSDQG